jgi:hypothetical protein
LTQTVRLGLYCLANGQAGDLGIACFPDFPAFEALAGRSIMIDMEQRSKRGERIAAAVMWCAEDTDHLDATGELPIRITAWGRQPDDATVGAVASALRSAETTVERVKDWGPYAVLLVRLSSAGYEEAMNHRKALTERRASGRSSIYAI